MILNSKKEYFLENGFCILENVISRSRLNKIFGLRDKDQA